MHPPFGIGGSRQGIWRRIRVGRGKARFLRPQGRYFRSRRLRSRFLGPRWMRPGLLGFWVTWFQIMYIIDVILLPGPANSLGWLRWGGNRVKMGVASPKSSTTQRGDPRFGEPRRGAI
jgi:hypothetical protein